MEGVIKMQKTATIVIPEHLLKDRYWKPVITIFTKHEKLKPYLFSKYINFKNRCIDIKGLLSVSKPWATSEKFMLRFALHLYNSSTKIDLAEIDNLDHTNRKLLQEALELRFNL